MSWPAPTGDPIRRPADGPAPLPAPGQAMQPPQGPQPANPPQAYPTQAPPAAQSPQAYTTQPYPPQAPAAGYPAQASLPEYPPQAPTPVYPGQPTSSQPTPAAPAPSWPAASAQPQTVTAHAPAGDIQTLTPPSPAASGLARISERTGQPVRPWTIWTSAALMFGAAIAVGVGLLMAMWVMASPWQQVGDNEWTKIDKFNEATWLTSQFPSEPASPWRVFFAILCCAIAVLVAAAATVVGYYAFAGYGWTRVGALVAAGVSLLSLLLTPIAAISIGCVALGAAPLWLPASARFFARWHLIRHPQIAYSEPIEQVFYGPLPRYR